MALGQREAITIFGDDYPTPDGTCIRDYIHVDDLGAAHLQGTRAVAPGMGLCLNLGTGRGHSVRQVIDACRRVIGARDPERSSPAARAILPELVADASRARRVSIGSRAIPELEQIVETAWRWHSTHPHGYGNAAHSMTTVARRAC